MITYNGSVLTGSSGAWVDYHLPDVPSYSLRFKFSNTSYVPTPGVTSRSGTWSEVDASRGIWDWTDTTSDWGPIYTEVPGSFLRYWPRLHLTEYSLGSGNTVEVIDGNTSGVTIMHSLFSGLEYEDTGVYQNSPSMLSSISTIDTSSVTTMGHMFYNCTNLVSIPLLDTSNVSNMDSTFAYCSNLVTIPSIDTSSVTYMEGMFAICTSLEEIPLLDTSSVRDMGQMFNGCTSLTTIPLLNTSRVTDMAGMFHACSSLTSIPLLDTSSVTDTREMFRGCTNLTTLPNLDMSSVVIAHTMCYECTSLTSVGFTNTLSLQGAMSMFGRCSSLQTVPLLNTSAITDIRYMFSDCYNVQSGALALYNQASTQATPPSSHDGTFRYCGRDTTTGAAELAQIPASWGGTAP